MDFIAERFFGETRDALADANEPPALRAVQANAHAQLDILFSLELESSGANIACKRGCWYCCHLKVDVWPSEVFLIADYVRRRFPSDDVERVKRVASENWRKIEPMNLDQHWGANLPCPFLKEGACSIYSVRPGSCRSFHAQTLSTCEESYQNPTDLMSPGSLVPSVRVACDSALAGVKAAYNAAGFDSQAYDLNPTIVAALESGKAERRWRDGKAAFPKEMRAKAAAPT